ncbi:hypothetical protein [Kitasatospora paranensis]|uniref:Uncharacterized protein n=1 Tax=Kitasatospora paranensis TaxID=258053 RepID=A0ABW2FSA0_9ACTN
MTGAHDGQLLPAAPKAMPTTGSPGSGEVNDRDLAAHLAIQAFIKIWYLAGRAR